uniref:hypothetical protein n=1 Tax=Rhodobacter ferrooxidans TaxID=371731 RepID=UPI001E3C02D7|nr:hypothetical protein [Rhodobacter sp. SW2]
MEPTADIRDALVCRQPQTHFGGLEPHVFYGFPISGKIRPSIVSVEVIDGKRRDRAGVRHTTIDSNPAEAVILWVDGDIVHRAPADLAKVKLELTAIASTISF